MRAAVLQGGKITIATVADPSPEIGQLLVSPLFTGICGPDLHFRSRVIAAEADTPEGLRDQGPTPKNRAWS